MKKNQGNKIKDSGEAYEINSSLLMISPEFNLDRELCNTWTKT